jgi:hypothetical protein
LALIALALLVTVPAMAAVLVLLLIRPITGGSLLSRPVRVAALPGPPIALLGALSLPFPAI